MSEALISTPAHLSQMFAPSDGEALCTVRAIEGIWNKMPQARLTTEHVFHAGVYSRTIRLKADMLMTNVLIKRATLVIVNGTLLVFGGGEWKRFEGYNVIPASAGRKQIFATISDCSITMIFPTSAATIAEAEAEFTDETALLASSRSANHDVVTFTGE
jgi:hypothetical protein